MQLSNMNRLTNASREVDFEHYCPECGAAMVEFDKLAEDGAVFIWYACTRDGCAGQWLTKRARRMCIA